jgi:hypothetical protein
VAERLLNPDRRREGRQRRNHHGRRLLAVVVAFDVGLVAGHLVIGVDLDRVLEHDRVELRKANALVPAVAVIEIGERHE